ncbi:MAG: quinol:electron acceptor oxidoreductase subunit ActD, partial [Myxococcota bacterium]
AVFGMLALNGLPRWHHPLFAARPFEQVTDDCFCLAIQTDDPRFNPEQTAQLLRQTGAQRIETVPQGAA